MVSGSYEGDGESKDEVGGDLGTPDGLVRGPCEGKMLRNTLLALNHGGGGEHKYMVVIVSRAGWARRVECAGTHKSLLAQSRAGEKSEGHGQLEL